VPESVFRLEIVFVEHIVMGNVAVVAVRPLTMGAVRPGSVLRGHDMAIDTGFRFVGEIGGGIGDFQDKNAESEKDAQQNDHGNFPWSGRFPLTYP